MYWFLDREKYINLKIFHPEVESKISILPKMTKNENKIKNFKATIIIN